MLADVWVAWRFPLMSLRLPRGTASAADVLASVAVSVDDGLDGDVVWV